MSVDHGKLNKIARMMLSKNNQQVLSGISIYAQSIGIALQITGKQKYSGSPRTFIKDNLSVIESYFDKNLHSTKKYKKTSYVAKKQISQKVDSVDFLNSYEWRVLRMQALKKYGPVCMCCGDSPKNGAVMNVDHIRPRKFFPSLALDIDNLQILCGPCNHGKGNWDQTDWRKGKS